MLIYEEHEFVDLSDGTSPTPSGYTRKNEITKTFGTKLEMDTFITKNILDNWKIYSYKTFHCFPTNTKVQLNEFKYFERTFSSKV